MTTYVSLATTVANTTSGQTNSTIAMTTNVSFATTVANTTSNSNNSTVAMNTVDERNTVHVNTTVSKTSTVLATESDVNYTYARCSFGDFGFFFYKGSGANLVRSSYFKSQGEEETGIVNMDLFGSHFTNHQDCKQHMNELVFVC